MTLLNCKITTPYGLIHSKNAQTLSFVKRKKINFFGNHLDYTNDDLFYIYSGICLINKKAFQFINLKECYEFEKDFFNTIINLQKLETLDLIDFWYAFETAKDVKDFNILNIAEEDKDKYTNFLKSLELYVV